ncbi:MAG TPA: hypothetical protein PKC69_06090 [Chitinophagaceae bacterium]|nr:hypothetical protein [Chitinophagaceae bacterium]
MAACGNGSSAVPTQEADAVSTPPAAATIASTAPLETSTAPATIDCAALLSTALIEEQCGLTDITERITAVERKGANCNRVYRKGKGWGDELIFILTVSSGTASLNYMKREYAGNGIENLTGIGDEAISLNFKDKLSGRQQHQVIFRKNNYLIELKTTESTSSKTPCPCYDFDKLKKLAARIAAKI